MSAVTIGLAAGTLVGMAVILTYILGWANVAFYVEVDPRVDAVSKVLPGANCGGCGFVGCGEYAEAVVMQGAPVNKCAPGGANCAAAIAQIMGVEVGEALPYRPIVHCGAHTKDKHGISDYRGERRCVTANIVADVQGCTYGCLGFGDCVAACAYDAIHVIDGLATVNYNACVGCGACAKACPRNIITMTPFKADRIFAVLCSNKDAGKEVKKVCDVGCLGCKACERACGLFAIKDNLSCINYDDYDPEHLEDIFKAIDKCPQKGIVLVGKPSEKDLAAVADKEAPSVVTPDFKTTVDDTEWRG
ncbi:MAG: RnfABCDGE type electron transport complex subunit B [Thermodesulfobacteriota bacterium]|nr:RnfABCDGE type electron transport complex subunit B [Thermodesulfobacteriota bacterium]